MSAMIIERGRNDVLRTRAVVVAGLCGVALTACGHAEPQHPASLGPAQATQLPGATPAASGTLSDGRSVGPVPTGDQPFGPADAPDLVAVVGEHGVVGYAEKEQLFPDEHPAGPREALADQQDGPQFRSIPVYAKDGHTVVDEFLVTTGSGWAPTG